MGRQACEKGPLPDSPDSLATPDTLDSPDSSFQLLFQPQRLALATRMSPRRVMEEFLQVWTWQLGASQPPGCLRDGGGGGGGVSKIRGKTKCRKSRLIQSKFNDMATVFKPCEILLFLLLL